MRLLRGEPLDAVARDSQVPVHELEAWRRVFVESGTQGRKKHVDPEDRELKRVQAKLGEVVSGRGSACQETGGLFFGLKRFTRSRRGCERRSGSRPTNPNPSHWLSDWLSTFAARQTRLTSVGPLPRRLD